MTDYELEFINYGKVERAEKYLRLLACNKENFQKSFDSYSKSYGEYQVSLRDWSDKKRIYDANWKNKIARAFIYNYDTSHGPSEPDRPNPFGFFETDESGRAYWELVIFLRQPMKSLNYQTIYSGGKSLDEVAYAEAYSLSSIPEKEKDLKCPTCHGKEGFSGKDPYSSNARSHAAEQGIRLPEPAWNTCNTCGGTGHYPDFEGAKQKLVQLNAYLNTFNSKLVDINHKVQDFNEITKRIS